MKPILFNTDMVRAILEGRKTMTRRVIKPQPQPTAKLVASDLLPETTEAGVGSAYAWSDGTVTTPPYYPGDTLYVRETFLQYDKDHIIDGEKYAYKANATSFSEQVRKELGYKWKPAIHMTKEAARIFLRVTDVRAEQLTEITREDALKEGAEENVKSPVFDFADIWNGTLKKADRDLYGFDQNPWVWVIGFEVVNVRGV